MQVVISATNINNNNFHDVAKQELFKIRQNLISNCFLLNNIDWKVLTKK